MKNERNDNTIPNETPRAQEKKAPSEEAKMWSRRRFLAQSAMATVGLGLWGSYAACQTPQPPGEQNQENTGDGGNNDTSLGQAIEITKGPYVQLAGARQRLRFETQSDAALGVSLWLGSQEITKAMVKGKMETLTYAFPADDPSLERRDKPGDYALHEIYFSDLTAGERYTWRVDRGGGERVEGSFRVPPIKGQPFRIGWLSDTMYPHHEKTVSVLTKQNPDLVWHGGDIQYQTNFLDTWEGVFQVFAPLLRQAPMHFCVGNHEYELLNEYDVFFVRLLGLHGEGGAKAPDYHGFTYGGVRFLSVNSERDLENEESAQMLWLKDELMRVEQSPDLAYAVVAFHRPYYTFGRHQPPQRLRGLLHPLLKQYNVPLVMTGHNHAYERFEADGIVYIVDGAGGAVKYNPDARLLEFQEKHPEEIPLRKFRNEEFGCTLLDFAADGKIKLTHVDITEKEIDTVTITPT
jgi:predicted phosphodiesterase